jgi:adenylyltransferase/sulfurtransferase
LQNDIERYQRQLLLKDVGEAGQKKLLNARVLVCGAGGLGSPALIYLAAAGIGHISLCDFDIVSQSNLNRQILYTPAEIGKQKAQIAKEKLEKFNPDIEVSAYPERLTEDTSDGIFKNHDILIDATDNFPSRYLINTTAYKNSVPLICGAVCEFEGILTTIVPKENTSCFQCIYPFKPSVDLTSRTFGILGAIAGIIGIMQALEAVKLILGVHCLKNKILIFNGIENTYRVKKIIKRKDCKACHISVQ